MKIHSFPSISNQESKVLILGTMPGTASLRLDQYYGHPRNTFWKLLFIIFNEPYSIDYEIRKKLVVKHNIALWDVLKNCEREGSLDSAIEKEIPNDFTCFLTSHPKIEKIVFNGKKAALYFKKYVPISNQYKLMTLPSTSPANAGVSFDEKLLMWKNVSFKS
ncbi:DNA-deoxyinosine glycosylase [Flavobacterium lacus]|uniref:G/U mismatch-specific uracil-DNA glycosylase n=1 Tax=Flavobacterium lacus TaxID=1353778 RepID=A0A328WT38_9FLAO|nr:DNA-deoxyinosine glycosylase [Flavobacterium lacus]RAR47617.1 G/U mismatch-specific uracil-DNA glycosylase [Flavobacterium lacus]